MTDFFLPEKINMMIKNISKPRLFYKKGITVGGFFRPYMSYSEYTLAAMFSGSEVITPVTIRFSAMLGDESTPDTVRNIKKMEVRFFTLKGSYDMLCQNIPVQFINDINKILKLFDVFKIKKDFDGINQDKFWRFVTENPETINAALHLYSSEGLSRSFIDISWYSVNTARWINLSGERYLVRMKWVPIQAESREKICMNISSAQFIAGFEPDIAHNEIIYLVNQKKYPKFELQIQIISEKDINNSEFYDQTLLWDECKYPFVSVGILMINKIVSDKLCNEICYMADNTVDGIDICYDDFTETFEYIYKVEAMERGVL